VPPEELDSIQFVQLVTCALDEYVKQHQRSIITGSAIVLIRQFIADVQRTKSREPGRFLKRPALEAEVRNLDGYARLEREQSSWNSIGNDLGRELTKFRFKTHEFGRDWLVTFVGPNASYGVPGKTGSLAVRAVVQDISTAQPRAPELGIAEAGDLIGRCLCCGTTYDYNLDQRLCSNDTCDAGKPRSDDADRDLFVSILPERRAADYTRPLVAADRKHLFAVVRDSFENPEALDSQTAHSGRDDDKNHLTDLLPYTFDHLANAGLALGIPLVYRAPHLSDWARFRDVVVLDMSTYRWSNTLKDPKSWAVINVAITAGLSKLALYTAGNAGASVAKMAYAMNGTVRDLLKVYALMDNTDDELSCVLRRWGARHVPLPTDGPRFIDPKTIWSTIASELKITEPALNERWHVTDGWEGVGIVMYRILFAEVVRTLRPNYVVLPIGTGSLFVGAHVGLRDVLGLPYPALLFGAAPAGKNILIANHGEEHASSAVPPLPPAIAPKLAGDYSPLQPCVSHIVERHSARIIDVSEAMQVKAILHMEDAAGRTIAAEPSAATAFGALCGDGTYPGLHEIARSIEAPRLKPERQFISNSRVLVVNTGLGVLSRVESQFMTKPSEHLEQNKNAAP